ncbi:MAG: DUF3267 domain-containing protein [Clostridia bacterium]
MEQQGMKKQLVAINMKKVSKLASLIFFIFLILGTVINIAAKGGLFVLTLWDILILAVGYVALIILHELLHGLAHLICGMKPADIKFGFIPKIMAAYCYGEKPLTVAKFRFVLVLPVIVTGIIPLIFAGIYLNILYIFLFSAMVAGGSGDLAMLWELRKYPRGQMLQDHPSAPAFYLLFNEDSLPQDFVEVTEEQERALQESITKKPRKK